MTTLPSVALRWTGSLEAGHRGPLYTRIVQLAPAEVLALDHPPEDCNLGTDRVSQCTLHHAIWMAGPRYRFEVRVFHVAGALWVLRLPDR